MPELKSGTVTFLFTDVESSTQLLHQLGPGALREGWLQNLVHEAVGERFACTSKSGCRCVGKRTAILSADGGAIRLMELAGLEPATSWVR